MFQAVVIMRSTGEVLLAESLGTDVDIILLSGFLGALKSFGQTLLKDEVLDTVELGNYRVFFESGLVEGEEILFVALTSRRANIAGIRPKLRQIMIEFIDSKIEQLSHGERGNLVQYEDFKPRIRAIVNERVVLMNAAQRNQVLGIFQKLYKISEYAIGAVLLTQAGEILQSCMEPGDVENITRLLEGRFLAGARCLKEIISVEDHGIVILIGNDEIITAVIFQSLCPLGTAELFAQRFADQIHAIFAQTKTN